MIKVLVNDGVHPDGKAMLEKAGFEVHSDHIPQAQLPEKLNAYDVICVRSATKVRKELIDQCPNLKIIARGGVGLDNIDVDYAISKGIKVINTPAASSEAVAELAFAHMFTISRFLHHANRNMPDIGDSEFKRLKKAYSKGVQLRGKTLGIIGFGRIGQAVARIGLGLGMNIMPVDLAFDEMKIDVNIFKLRDASLSVTLKTDTMDDMLAKADFLTIHVPFKAGGRPLIGEAEFAKMKDGVRVVNTARGGAIDEDALLAAIASGKVAAAGLDVFENEPTPRKEILENHSISLTPHIGASTGEAQRNIGLELADKIMTHFTES